MYDVIEEYLKVNDCTIYASNGMYVNTQLEPSIVNEADGYVIDVISYVFLCELIISTSIKSAIYGMCQITSL